MKVIINNEVKPEKYNRLTIAALMIRILTYSYLYLIPKFIVSFVLYLRNFIQQESIIATIVLSSVFILLVYQ